LSDNLHNLGPAVVFDADNMVEGQHVILEGHLFFVSKIQDERVFLQPVVGISLLTYKIKRYSLWISFGAAIAALTAFYVYKGY